MIFPINKQFLMKVDSRILQISLDTSIPNGSLQEKLLGKRDISFGGNLWAELRCFFIGSINNDFFVTCSEISKINYVTFGFEVGEELV